MITKKEAMQLKYREVLEDTEAKNADGTPVRWRVSGNPKEWKRDKEKFRVPVKHGLYDNWEITPATAYRFKRKKMRSVS